MGIWADYVGRGRSFRDYDPSASRGDPPHCSYTEQWVQFSPILNQRSVEQWPVWINYNSRNIHSIMHVTYLPYLDRRLGY